MKKTYLAPELNIIEFDITDIITNSNGTASGEPDIDFGDDGTPEIDFNANFIDSF